MRGVIQRVKEAHVKVDDKIVGEIGRGILLLLGIESGDDNRDIEYILRKTVNLRIFPDKNGKMNLSLKEVGGELLVVSQFTLLGDCRKGRRPSYSKALSPNVAEKVYKNFLLEAKKIGIKVESGIFQAMMDVFLVNEGPVTLLLDSKKTF